MGGVISSIGSSIASVFSSPTVTACVATAPIHSPGAVEARQAATVSASLNSEKKVIDSKYYHAWWPTSGVSYEECFRLREEREQVKKRLAEEKKRAEEEQQRIKEQHKKPEWLPDPTLGLNIGFTGDSGVGKSSFINFLMGLKESKDAKAAKTGEAECTMEPTPFPAPHFGKVTFWDLPGGGTPKFPTETYIDTMGLRYFDALIVISANRYRQIDEMIFQAAVRKDIPSYMVRNKVDQDIDNARDKAREACDSDSDSDCEFQFDPSKFVADLFEDHQGRLRKSVGNDDHCHRAFILTTKTKKYPEFFKPQYESLIKLMISDVLKQRGAKDEDIISTTQMLDSQMLGAQKHYLKSAEKKQKPGKASASASDVQRLHGLGQINEDLLGTYTPIRKMVKDFQPQRSIQDYVMEAGAAVMPATTCKYLPDILEEVSRITSSLLEVPSVKSKLDANNIDRQEVFAIVLYSFDLELIYPDDWNGDKKDNWYYVQNVLLQQRSYQKLQHMQGFLYFLMSGLQKLPDWQGELYRGIDENGARMIEENYTEGRHVHFSGSTSATADADVSKGFMGDNGVLLCMRVRSGREIAFLSALPSEQEVLLCPNIAFVVSQAFHFNDGFGCNVVFLTEVSEGPSFIF